VGGGRVLALDGTEKRATVNYAYRFDAVTASPDGRFVVIYERLGTKGLLLRDGQILREIDRSFYHASAYEYPVALFHEPGGRLLLAHCPKDYCRLELEEAETGRLLTVSAERKPSDFFHSRLAASPNGKRLLSAGWVWHPRGVVVSFDVARTLEDPRHLDRGEAASRYSADGCLAEEDSACWLDNDHIAVSASDEIEEDPEVNREADGGYRLVPRGVAVFDLTNERCVSAFQLDEQPGTILPVGPHHILSLYRHPKLIDLSTGKVLHVWTELHSGLQNSSIVWGLKEEAKPPPMAFDPASSRFAMADRNGVTIIEFDHSALGSPFSKAT
jgi:hypothetical protein